MLGWVGVDTIPIYKRTLKSCARIIQDSPDMKLDHKYFFFFFACDS